MKKLWMASMAVPLVLSMGTIVKADDFDFVKLSRHQQDANSKTFHADRDGGVLRASISVDDRGGRVEYRLIRKERGRDDVVKSGEVGGRRNDNGDTFRERIRRGDYYLKLICRDSDRRGGDGRGDRERGCDATARVHFEDTGR